MHAARTKRVLMLIVQMAEVAVPRELLAAILRLVKRFGVPPPLVQRG